MSLYKIIKNIFTKNIIIFFIFTNVCFLTIFNFTYKEYLYSEIEIKFNDSTYLNLFEKEIHDKINFENWKLNSNLQLTYSDYSKVVSIDNTYGFLNSKSFLKIISKNNYYAYQFIYSQDDYILAYELYNYLIYIRNNRLKKNIMELLDNKIGLMSFLGFNTYQKFSEKEINDFANILINDLFIELPTVPKNYGINKTLKSIFYSIIIDLIMIITLLIFKFKFIRKIIFKN